LCSIMLALKKKLVESRQASSNNNFFELQNNGQLIVNQSVTNPKKLQYNDQLYSTMSGMSITLIKWCMVDIIVEEEHKNAQDAIMELDNILLYYDMRQKLRKFMADNNIQYFQTIKSLQLFKLHQKFFETNLVNIGNEKRTIGDCVMEMHFLSINVSKWQPNQLALFVKLCGFSLRIRHGLQLSSYKMLSKIVNDKIDPKMLLNFGTNELLKLVDNDDDVYIMLLYAIKCITMLLNDNHDLKKDVVLQLKTLKEHLQSEPTSNCNAVNSFDDNNNKYTDMNNGENDVLNNIENYPVNYNNGAFDNKNNGNINNNNYDNVNDRKSNEYFNDNPVTGDELTVQINGKRKNTNMKMDNEYDQFTVAKLREKLKSHGLNIKGNKDVLIDRLNTFDKLRKK